MLSYEEFRAKLKEELLNYMSPIFAEGKVVLADTEVDGVKRDIFYIKEPDKEVGIPMLLKPVYETMYMGTYSGNFEKTIKDISLRYEKGLRQRHSRDFNTPFAQHDNGVINVKFDINNVFFCVVNMEGNAKYMTAVPHKDHGDMSIYLRLLLSDDGKSMNTMIIDNNLLAEIENKGITFEELVEHSVQNTPKIFPAEINMIENGVYSISNKAALFGSAALLYPESPLQSIAENNSSDLIVLPCDSDFSIAFVPQDNGGVMPDEDMYRQYNLAIRQYIQAYGKTALAAYPFIYDRKERRLITDKEEALSIGCKQKDKSR